MTPYSESLKAKLVQRMTGPRGLSASALSREVGISQATLSRWLLRAGNVPLVKKSRDQVKPLTADQKMRIVLEASRLSSEELGAFLRREGVHEAELAEWRETVMEALQGAPSRAAARARSEDKRRLKKLERELVRKDKALAEAAALLVLQKKSPPDMGGRGRRHGGRERQVILDLLDEATMAGARPERACAELGLSLRTVQRWRAAGVGNDRRRGPLSRPANTLSSAERHKLLATVNSAEYRDLSPKQIVPRLADAGRYLASESTIYRLLRSEGQLAHRGRAKAPTRHEVKEHVATGLPWSRAASITCT